MDDMKLDPKRQKEAKAYARIRRRIMLVELVLGMTYTAAWVMFGWGQKLAAGIHLKTGKAWLDVPLFALIFFGLYFLIDLPITFFSGYALPHRFQLSNQKLQSWINDLVKSLLLSALFGLLILGAVYAVLNFMPVYWWLLAGAFLLVVNVVIANLAPVLLLPIFFKLTPLSEEYQELSDRLVRLCEQAGTRVKGIFQIDMSRRTKTANAAITGLGSTRRIILGDTLLSQFTLDEIETVFAHELGHQVHKDIPAGMVFESLLTLGGLFLTNLGLIWGVEYFGFAGIWDVAAMPLLVLVLGGFGLLTMPLGNAFSRWREKRADLYALEVTGNGKAFASALIRLANQNLAETDPENWVEFLLYSHPALRRRIELANQYSQEQAA